MSIFICKKDEDIEAFSKEKSVYFEKIGTSRTFFIFRYSYYRNSLHLKLL